MAKRLTPEAQAELRITTNGPAMSATCYECEWRIRFNDDVEQSRHDALRHAHTLGHRVEIVQTQGWEVYPPADCSEAVAGVDQGQTE